jgi:hypothetical protein
LNPWLPPCERVGGKRHANLHLRSSRGTVRGKVRWREEGGLDERSLGIAPIVAGPGMRLFEEITEPFPLQLAESGALSTGMLTVI